MPDATKVHRIYRGTNNEYIQSVRFKKAYYSEKEAYDYCIKHDYYVDGLDTTENEYRFRQSNLITKNIIISKYK